VLHAVDAFADLRQQAGDVIFVMKQAASIVEPVAGLKDPWSEAQPDS
jgi:hypothetical protein